MKHMIVSILVLLASCSLFAFEQTMDTDVTVQLCSAGSGESLSFTSVITVTVNLMEITPDLRRFNLQVWSANALVMEVAATTEMINVTGIYRPKFRLVDRDTGESVLLIRSQPFIRIPCEAVTPVSDAYMVWLNIIEWSYEIPVPRPPGGRVGNGSND